MAVDTVNQNSTETTTSDSDKQHWSSISEAGSLTGLRFLWFVHRRFGRGLLSLMLRPVVIYFILFKSEARQGANKFFSSHQQRFPELWSRKPGLIDLYRLFREFAESVVDKLLAWHLDINADDFYQRNPEARDELLEDSRGQLIIGSHLGNIEYCRGYMHRYQDKVVNILIYDRHAANYVEMMRQLNPESRINVFQVDDFDIATILLLKEKIDAGEWLFIAGDRIPLSGTERTVTVNFLGKKTQLPIGPYLLAHALQCPVRLIFSFKNYGGVDNRLHFEVVKFAEKINLPRRKREQLLPTFAQAYADQLERICREAPYQWFNFYDYWADAQQVKTETK